MAKKKRQEHRWSMYPDLHGKVLQLLAEDGLYFAFHDMDQPIYNTREYDTHIMGRFQCLNPECDSDGWSSKKVTITIRLYEGDGEYNARVYHQRCLTCNRLSRPILDEDSYVDRVAYRLRKWSGIDMDIPVYTSGDSNGPHQKRFCEGCMAGHCTMGRQG